MKDLIGPGHVYQDETGNGIKWFEGRAELWFQNKVIATGSHQTASPWEFWYTLAFAASFPQVTHWWFRSAWTQKVRLTRGQGMVDDRTAWGLMQFTDEQTPGEIWTVRNGGILPEVAPPMPPMEEQPVNLPLRIALSRLIIGVLQDEIRPDTWYLTTSLVRREELEQVFPTDISAMGWKIESVNTPLRHALCRLQGLREEEPNGVPRTV